LQFTEVIDFAKSLKSPKVSKAGTLYKIGTTERLAADPVRSLEIAVIGSDVTVDDVSQEALRSARCHLELAVEDSFRHA
jgi:hypothetical protein